MTRFAIRKLSSDDFAHLASLENDVFGAMGEAVLCPHYLRVCTEIFHDSCFIAFDGERPVGYLLAFITGREAHCTTLAVIPEYQKTRVTVQLIGAFVRRIIENVDDRATFERLRPKYERLGFVDPRPVQEVAA